MSSNTNNCQYLIDVHEKYKHKGIDKTKDCHLYLQERSYCDYLTVLPKHGRDRHFMAILKSYNDSLANTENSHKIVVVEQAENPDVKNYCKENNINYIFIPKGGELFNKCLCMNIGALSYDSKYIHFHDIDILIPKDFWPNLRKNMQGHNFVQSFSGRKVNYVSEQYTNAFFDGIFTAEQIANRSGAWTVGKSGAPGGSIVVKRDLFESIGGFDPYYFQAYSIEDQFFLDKIEVYSRFKGCDNPAIEMFHLWHPSNEKATPIHIRKNGLKARMYFKSLLNHEKIKLLGLYKTSLQCQSEIMNGKNRYEN